MSEKEMRKLLSLWKARVIAYNKEFDELASTCKHKDLANARVCAHTYGSADPKKRSVVGLLCNLDNCCL